MFFYLVIISLIIWIVILILPWRPWETANSLDSSKGISDLIQPNLAEITVLIPARNEENLIEQTLSSVIEQGVGLNIILIDDCSNDNTAKIAQKIFDKNKRDCIGKVIKGLPKPKDWSGKLWALNQGLKRVNTEYVLLVDADIFLKKGILATAFDFLKKKDIDLLSLMAKLRMDNVIECLFMPAFIYFFKLLYPFSLVNQKRSFVAAAAGGFILTKTKLLKKINAFESLKDALIDDCTLAKMVKKEGGSLFLALTHSIISKRRYKSLSEIWQMVSRTAYTQLRYNPILLIAVTVIMSITFLIPVLGLFQKDAIIVLVSLVTIIIMAISYIPILRYYGLRPSLAFSLPLVGITYLLMTWSSAKNYYFGKKAYWKGRTYL